MQLDRTLFQEINEYCKINGLKTRDFIHKMLKEAFMKEKYGETPFKKNKTEILEEEACDEIKNLVENQVSLPPEIIEVVDDNFFDLLVCDSEENKKKKDVLPAIDGTRGSVVETGVNNDPPKPKKKRKLI